jgi:short-subunit dehydrogenase
MTTALITGASGGIGLELARLFAADKHNLILVARSGDKLNALKLELEAKFGIAVYVFEADLSKSDAAKDLMTGINNKNLNVDFLINNAGFGTFGLFQDSAFESTNEMMRLNMETLTALTHLVLPGMLKRKSGRIMNIASTAAFQAGPLMAVYFATKAYVLRFSEALANELKGSGVSVTVYCPAATESGFQAAAQMEDSRLVKNRKLDTAENVAKDAYKAMMGGKTIAIYGVMNAILAKSSGFFPSAWSAKIARWMMERSA